MISAKNGWVQVFDNLSDISDSMSDALCRLSTGGGFSTRKLYQDDEELLINVERPIVLNGIEPVAVRSDLLDRTVKVHLRPIPAHKRKDEDTFWAEFNRELPTILGGVLKAISSALKNKGKVQIAEKPRMADFAVWVAAAEEGLGWKPGTFAAAYQRNRNEAHEMIVNESPVAAFVKALSEKGGWRGTATDLWEAMRNSSQSHLTPRAPHALSGTLTRLAPNLRAVGVEVVKGEREGHDGTRIIVIRKAEKNTVSSGSTVSDEGENAA